MELGSVTNLNKINKTTLKNVTMTSFHQIVTLLSSSGCDVIVISPVYGQFGAIRKPDSESIVCKTYIFINNNLLS